MSEAAAAKPAQDTPNAGAGANTEPPASTAAAAAAATTPPAKVEGAAAAAAVDAKPADSSKGPDSKEPPAATPAVPEKYDLKLPEGSKIDAKAVEDFSAFAKAQGLSNIQAQAQLDREIKAKASVEEGQRSEFEARKATWVQSLEADKEIGGDALKENVELAKRVVDRYGSEAFKKTLNDTGLGNHPELVRVFARLGKEMGEDKLFIPRAQTTNSTQAVADRLYPSTAENNKGA